jgi:superfamily II DNA/RNA helicase
MTCASGSTPTPRDEPLRILVCTDAAREGINLHAHCADLFHFDLPWNPSRLEQRNGRIDRKGQPAAQVQVPLLRMEAAARGQGAHGPRGEDRDHP